MNKDKQIFSKALKSANLERIQESLNQYNSGLIPEEVAIEDILLNLGVIDKPVSLNIKEYEEKAQEIVENQINQTLENNKS